MAGKRSRTKGAAAEREWANLLKANGWEASRNRIGVNGDDILHSLDRFISFEVKRAESLRIPQWVRQAEEQAAGRVPVLAYRQNGEPWRVVVSADHYLDLVSQVYEWGEDD